MGGRRMKSVLALCLVAYAVAAPAAKYTSWTTHGEEIDPAVLGGPAITDDLVSKLNSKNLGYVAGHNDIFLNATLAQAKILMGTLQHTDSSEWLPHKVQKSVQLPTEFDWRTDSRAAKCASVKEIRDQANCGSCWAFGSVEAMSDRSCIKGKYTHFSAQDVASCDKLGDMGCSGGVPSTVYSYSKTFGVVDGGNYGDKSGCWS